MQSSRIARAVYQETSMPVWPLLYRGSDPFGGPVMDGITGIQALELIGEAVENGWIQYTSFHDDDILDWDPADPEDYLKKNSPIHKKIADLKKVLDDGKIKVNMMTGNLHAHPLFTNGGFANPDPFTRALALKKAIRAAWIGKQLGAKRITYWVARDGYEVMPATPFKGYSEVKDGPYQWIAFALNVVARGCCALGYEAGTIEPKDNEPRSVVYLALVSSALSMINLLDDPDFWNVNPEVLQHSMMGNQEAILEIIQAVEVNKLPFFHLGSQRPGMYDCDYPPLVGSVGFKPTVEIFYYLKKVNWKGIVEFDCHPLRGDCKPGKENGMERRRHFIKNCVKSYRFVDGIIVPRLMESEALTEIQTKLWTIGADSKCVSVLSEPVDNDTIEAIQKLDIDIAQILENPAEAHEVDSQFTMAMVGVTDEMAEDLL